MPPRLRKLALVAHVAIAVGWMGALAAYIALDVAAVTSADPLTVRAAYIGLDWVVQHVIVPLAVLTLLTGLLMALGTKWGLFRHYWVLVSFLLTAAATAVLLVETQTISHLAGIAADPGTSAAELRELPGTLVHSIGGMAVLLVVFVLNMYKPQGVTRYGWRKQQIARREPPRG